MKFEEVKKLIQQECKALGVKFYQGRGKTVKFNHTISSNGYFFDGVALEEGHENQQPVLAVATNENSLDVMIHEFGHLQQFFEGWAGWEDLPRHSCLWAWVLRWEDSDDIPDEDLDAATVAFYNLELDCEKRAVELHKQWNTGTNIEEYIQKANAYTMFYIFMRHNRCWYEPGKEPYSVKELWSQMPKTFDFNRDECYNSAYELFKLCIKE